MLLAIDIGNTNTVFALFDANAPEKALNVWRLKTVAGKTEDEYAVHLTQLFSSQGVALDQISQVILASVVPDADAAILRLCQKYFDIVPMIVGDKSLDLNIEINVDKPDEVGADRLVNAIAARASYDTPLIIVDFGTATTFDIVSAKGVYDGGIIAPGPNLSLEALYLAAAKLPKVDIKKPESVIGRNTVTAMQAGLYWGYVYMIDGLLSKLKQEMNEQDVTVIATGGLAQLFAGDIEAIDHIDQELTLDGLKEIYCLNKDNLQPKQKDVA